MTTMYMLDTDVVSYVVRRRPIEYFQRLLRLDQDDVVLSVITEGELLAGLVGLPPDHRLHRGTVGILREFRILPWDRDAAIHFAPIQHHLESTGKPIGAMDTLIAAHAITLGATLVTGNIRHHGRVPGLTMEDWRE